MPGGAKCWVGLDVGAFSTSVCVIDGEGSVQREVCCETNVQAVRSALKGIAKRRISAVSVESGSVGTHLIRGLRDRRYPVVIFEARKASKFLAVRRNKTDASDARGLAEVARVGRSVVSEVRLKTLENQMIRSKLAMRHKLVQQRIALEGCIRCLFRLYGLTFRKRLHLREYVEGLLREAKKDGVDIRDDIIPLVTLVEGLRTCIASLEAQLRSIAAANPTCSAFMQIPGVGPITALSFLTAIEEPTRFTRATDVGAYLGLTPRTAQSGVTTKRGKITKMGSTLTRTHLILSAQSHLFGCRAESALQSWGLTLTERIGVGRARTAVARKLAVIMLSMWKKGVGYEPQPKGVVGQQRHC